MKKIIHILPLFLLMLTQGCELNREDYTEIYPENFFKTEKDLELAVNALYNQFTSGYSMVYGPGNDGYQIFTEMTTDALWCTWGWEWDDLHYQQWYATIGGNLSGIVWNSFSRYNYLSTARNTVRSIENSEVREDVRLQYSAEARALRGWMGLYLYDLFGPVPVVPDEVLDNPQEFVYLPRLTEEEYDAFMEEDLLFAMEYLSETPRARGRLTKGAAGMILLKYYMMRGSFVKAEAIARELAGMEGSVYRLQSDYNYIFTKEGIGNNEILLQIPCNVSNMPNFLTTHIVPGDYPWTERSENWGAYVMPWDFYDTYEVGDERLKNIISSYVNTTGELMEREKNGNLQKGAIPLKYGKDPEQMGTHSGIDIVVYRFSDVLLSLAECIVRNQGTPTGEAVALVNRVRNRVGLTDLLADKTSGQEAFLEAILQERGHEFYMEGLRRQDLIRFGKYVEKANERIRTANQYEGKGYFEVHNGHTRFWIPQDFIDESKGAIVQNNYDR